MTQIFVDPQKLREFASQLKKFREEIGALKSNLESQLALLSNTWYDQEQEKFVKEFSQAIVPLNNLCYSAESYSAYLIRKAEAIEPYSSCASTLSSKGAGQTTYRPALGEVFYCGHCRRQQGTHEGERCKDCGRTTVSWYMLRESEPMVVERWKRVNGKELWKDIDEQILREEIE